MFVLSSGTNFFSPNILSIVLIHSLLPALTSICYLLFYFVGVWNVRRNFLLVIGGKTLNIFEVAVSSYYGERYDLVVVHITYYTISNEYLFVCLRLFS